MAPDTGRSFSKILKPVRLLLLAGVFILIILGISHTISAAQSFTQPAADLNLTPQATTDTSRFLFVDDHKLDSSYVVLAGGDYLSNIVFTTPGSLTATLNKRFRDVRLVVTDASGNVVADTLLHPERHTLELQTGNYQLYAVGNGFSGSLHLKSDNGHFQDEASEI